MPDKQEKDKPKRERVKSGSVSLPFYPWTNPNNGRQYWRWSWKDDTGKWNYGTRADRSEALEAARARARSISRGLLDLETITVAQADLVRQFLALSPTEADVTRLREWKAAAATELLPVVTHWCQVKLAEVHGTETPHLKNLRQWYEKLASHFSGRPVAALTAAELDAYIQASSSNPTSRRYARSRITALWKFARVHDYFDSAEADKIPAYRAGRQKSAVVLWTTEEMQTLLAGVRPAFLPWLCFAAFSGLRSEEIRPKPDSGKPAMDWSWVRRRGTGGHIDVPAAASKVGKRRLVPITPTLAAWLKHMDPPKSGPVCESLPSAGETQRLGELVGGWRKNALRHSYGSNRAAITRDLPSLALEMGNSVEMVEKHYREALTKSAAAKFWALNPSEVLQK